MSVTGEDRLSFLQGLGTNDFIDITEEKVGKIDEGGTAFTTAFLNGKGQLLGSAQVLLLGDCVKLLVESPAAARTLKEYFEKYLFPLDRVKVKDISKKTRVIHSLFPQDQVVGRSKQHTAEVQVVGESYRIVGSNGLCDCLSFGGDTYISEGDSSLSPLLGKEDVKTETIEGDCATQVYEDALQLAGQASVMNDLVPYNITALEAGFMASIHFRKGCFVGNEVVSKQVSTKAIRRHLVGLRIADDIGGGEGLKAGEPVIDPDTEEVVGIVLKPPRALSTESKGVVEAAGIKRDCAPALCLVKTKLAHEGKKLTVGTSSTAVFFAEVENLGFPQYSPAASPAPPVEKVASKGKNILVEPDTLTASIFSEPAGNEALTSEEKEAARKAAKLAAMAARVAKLKKKKA